MKQGGCFVDVTNFFIIWQDIGLILYSILKAFLPLPSLEVILTPLCLYSPHKWLLYSFEGAIGTCIGGAIGYGIAYHVGRRAFSHIASDEDIQKGEALMKQYGLLAVFIGGITPIPDFLLAYLAGFTHMRFIPFILCDGFARLLRSLLVTYCLQSLQAIPHIDTIGSWLSFLILFWLVYKWYRSRKRLQTQRISIK